MAIFPKAGRLLACPPGTRGARGPPAPNPRLRQPHLPRCPRVLETRARAWPAGVAAEWRAGDRPCPAPVLQQGGPGLRPETARPQGAAPRAGVSPVAPARPSVNSAPRTPPGAFPTGSGQIWASAAAAWLGRGRQGPRGSGERPSLRDHVGGGSSALACRPRPRRPLHRRRVVPHAGRVSPDIPVHGGGGLCHAGLPRTWQGN